MGTLLNLPYIATRRKQFHFVGMTQSVSSVHHPLEATETVPSLRHSSESTETSLQLQPIEEAVEQVSRGEARGESLPRTWSAQTVVGISLCPCALRSSTPR